MRKTVVLLALLPSLALAATGQRSGSQTITGATSSQRGTVRLTGDLGGTADNPSVVRANAAQVTATGSGTTRPLADWARYGPVSADGTTVTAAGGSAPRPLREWFPEEVIRPSGDTSGATDVAAINAATAAGRAVRLVAGVYYLNAPLNLGDATTKVGYTVIGEPWSYDYSGQTIVGGTELRAVGTTDGFSLVPTLYSSQPTVTQAIAQAVGGTRVENLVFNGFRYAIRAGSLYNTGVWHATFRNLLAINVGAWGFWFENFQSSTFDRLYVRRTPAGAAGNMMFAASQNTFFQGNSLATHLYGENKGPNQRGIVFRAYGGVSGTPAVMNDLNVFDVQNNQSGAAVSATATSAGSTSLVLSAYGAGSTIASFPVDMPVTVGTTSLGLTRWQTYFVISNDGVDTITIADRQGGTAKTVTAGSVELRANGFPSIEVVGYGPSTSYANITGTTIYGVDAEGPAGTEVLVQNAWVDRVIGMIFGTQGTNGTSQVFSSIVGRAAAGTFSSLQPVVLDLDYGSPDFVSRNAKVLTSASTTGIVQRAPTGIWYDSERATWVLSFMSSSGNQFKRSLQSQKTLTGGSFVYPEQPMGQKVSNTQSPTLALTEMIGGTVCLVGGSAATWTLPQLYAGAPGTTNATQGQTYELGSCSPSGLGVVTINTWSQTNGANPNNGNTGSSDDTFQNSSKTSYTCPQGAGIVVRANWTGTKAFWQVISNNGCT